MRTRRRQARRRRRAYKMDEVSVVKNIGHAIKRSIEALEDMANNLPASYRETGDVEKALDAVDRALPYLDQAQKHVARALRGM